MNIAFINYRLGETDGVSLTDSYIAEGFRKLGHKIFFCAGYLKGNLQGKEIPLLDFYHPRVSKLNRQLFDKFPDSPNLEREIFLLADELQLQLDDFLSENHIQVVFSSNVLSIGLNVAFAVALTRIAAENKITIISRDCEFWWQREYFTDTNFGHLLLEYLPPKLENIRHIVINTHTQNSLKVKTGIKAEIFHDLFDFSYKFNKIDDFNRNFRKDFDIPEKNLVILQPSRIVRRKRVDRGVVLAAKLSKYSPSVIITGFDGDETEKYASEVASMAKSLNVDLKFLADRMAQMRSLNGKKTYSLFDAYVNSDLVAYMSDLEGFGNQVIETVFFRKPLVINSYKVYEEDIKPYGFDFIEVDGGQVTPLVIFKIEELLKNPRKLARVVAQNFEIGKKYFSIEAKLPFFKKILEN